MNVTIEARHFAARDSLKSYTENELKRLKKFYDRILDAHVILDGKLYNKKATITINVWGQQLVASDTAPKFEIAVEGTVDKLVHQVKKYKDKMIKR